MTQERPANPRPRFAMPVLLAGLVALAPPASAATTDDPSRPAPPEGTLVGSGLTATIESGAVPGEIVFRLVNDSPRAVDVLRAGTPLEAVLSSDAFRIERVSKRWPSAERARYTGRVVKRVAPTDADFVTLAAGESRTVTIPLAQYYDAPASDRYLVDWQGEIHVRSPTADPLLPRSRIDAAAGIGSVRLAARGVMTHLAGADESTLARPAAFDGCGAARRDALDEATPAAERLVEDALGALAAHAGGALASAPRYTRWFGPWTPSRERHATAVYAGLLDTLSGTTLTYDCRCDDASLYAYVYPSRPGDVFLCPAFFAAPVLGTDSQAGTLVHELSHFAVANGGTHDHVYGQHAVARLALDDPERAIDNADSYEYFAENSPALPMSGGVPQFGETPLAASSAAAAVTAFTPLPLDAILSGTLDGGRVEHFTTKGAGLVSVDSLGGDADLYVFADAALHALVCASTSLERSGAAEICRVDERRTAYVVVHAYTDTRYAIRASGMPAAPIALVSGNGMADAGDAGRSSPAAGGQPITTLRDDGSEALGGPPSVANGQANGQLANGQSDGLADGLANGLTLEPTAPTAPTAPTSGDALSDTVMLPDPVVADVTRSKGGLGASGAFWLLGAGALLVSRRQRNVLVDR